MFQTIDTIRRKATQQLDQSKRAQFGQFLTPGPIANFMSSLFQNNEERVHLLDAGAGVGSLTAAFLERIVNGLLGVKSIEVTEYEIDILLATYLGENLSIYSDLLKQKNIVLKTKIINSDFISDEVLNILEKNRRVFTHAILNPPYKKINTTSEYRRLLSSIGFETVNLYSAFVGLSLMLLKDGGELVAIIPRSFCNGNYYKSFRNLLIENSAIKRIHLFESRNQAFKEDDVLQENIIIHLVKNVEQGDVIISRSTDGEFKDLSENTFNFEQIIKPNDKEVFIHIPHIGENLIENSKSVIYTLSDLGIQVSTGPVVDFRSKEYIFMNPGNGKVPLLYANHFNGRDIEWPRESKKPNAISLNSETQRMLYPKGFYVVVRRFSSKEEKQRVVARVVNPHKLEAEFIGIENHLNVFHFGKKGINEDLAYGLAAFLNSSFVDIYFRSFNGHTQVNATDLKQMKYPSLKSLMKLGAQTKNLERFEPQTLDQYVKIIL